MTNYDPQEEQEQLLHTYDQLQQCWFHELLSERPDWLLLAQLDADLKHIAAQLETAE